jgi:hypothetical protein
MSMACPQLQHPARECRRLADGSQIGTKIAALLCPLQPRLDDTRQPRERVKQRIDASIGLTPDQLNSCGGPKNAAAVPSGTMTGGSTRAEGKQVCGVILVCDASSGQGLLDVPKGYIGRQKGRSRGLTPYR